MNTIAYFAHLDEIEGTAMCLPDRTVHFRSESTHVWTELFDTDMPRLQLHGWVDLDTAARLADGDLVLKASRTAQVAR